jgi:predicted nucleic acid-binding Zn ribbon protein
LKQIGTFLGPRLGAPEVRPVDDTRQHRCLDAWRRTVEPALFEHTRVVAFDDGHWTVYAESGAWASRVREQHETILNGLRAAGADLVELRIRVVPGGRRLGHQEPERRS